MKSLLTILIILFSLSAGAQTIDSTVKTSTAVLLRTPMRVTWNDTSYATHLAVSIISDNLKNSALFSWSLINSRGRVYQSGALELSGTDYYSWNGNNLFPFQYVADEIGLALK